MKTIALQTIHSLDIGFHLEDGAVVIDKAEIGGEQMTLDQAATAVCTFFDPWMLDALDS